MFNVPYECVLPYVFVCTTIELKQINRDESFFTALSPATLYIREIKAFTEKFLTSSMEINPLDNTTCGSLTFR